MIARTVPTLSSTVLSAPVRADTENRFSNLRADIDARFIGEDRRFDAVDRHFDDINQRLTNMHQTLRTSMWVVSGWFTFLTAVLAVFGFLRR